jgi:HlyD family secretion protein
MFGLANRSFQTVFKKPKNWRNNMNLKKFLTKNKKGIAILGVIVVLAVAFAFLWPRSGAAASNAYQTEVAGRGDLSAMVGATGTVRAIQSATLTWQAGGIVETVKGKLGDTVREGDVLASLAQSSLTQNIILAEADLVAAQQELDDLLNSDTDQANAVIALRDAQEAYDKAVEYRQSLEGKIDIQYIVWVEGLPKAKVRRGYADETEKAKADEDLALKQGQLEDAQRAYDRLKDGPNAQDIAAAEAKVAAAQATLNQAMITAPFNGLLTDASVLAGDQVAAGKMAFQVDDLSHLLIDVDISKWTLAFRSERIVNSMQAAQDYHGGAISVAGSRRSGGANFKVTVELSDADELVKPGMTAAVLIQVRNVEDALLVPNRAVRVVDAKRVVYTLAEDGSLTPVEVRLGATSDTHSEVVGGDLQEGDQVVLNPPATANFGPGNGPGNGNNPFAD